MPSQSFRTPGPRAVRRLSLSLSALALLLGVLGGGAHACGDGAGATCGGTDVASQGNNSQTNQGAGNPINLISGNKYQREVDMPALPGVLGLEIVRYYNSQLSGTARDARLNGILGRGWKLSYDTELAVIGNTVEIAQADGTRIAFGKDLLHPGTVYRAASPLQGRVIAVRKPRGTEYTWVWSNGRQLNFNADGKLVQIAAPTGEFVRLQRDAQGWLVQVTDPQGRSLHLHYLDRKLARAGGHFRGVQSIDSPVGRFTYGYGSELPEGSTVDKAQVLANLVKVGIPTHYEADRKMHPWTGRGVSGSSISRIYHYEDARFPTLLTGISVIGQGSDGKLVNQRISTWRYDDQGRARLSVKGEPARYETDKEGRLLEPKRPAPGTGIEQVTLRWPRPGQTVLTNSLGQRTTYTTATIAGELRILEVRGPGCSTCGPGNRRYGYDSLGRLTEETALDTNGQPLQTTRTELDGYGRPIRVSTIAYRNGKPQPAQWRVRYAYPAFDEQAAPADPAQVPSSDPVLIARPSVAPGKEHQIRIAYNGRGQPARITESGFSPAPDGGAVPIERTATYRYQSVNGRSVLAAIDGPLKNGPRNSPEDSDITRLTWDRTGSFVTAMTAPGAMVIEALERDDVLRPTKVRASDGAGVQTAMLRLNWRGQPEEISIEAALFKGGGNMTRQIDETTRLVRTLRYRYDVHGLLTSITQPGNLTSRFQYDTAGRLTQRILPDGSRVTIGRDSEDRLQDMASYADLLGKAISQVNYRYDDMNRLAQIGDGEGAQSRYRYTGLGQIAAATNALGAETQFAWDDNGLLTLQTRAAGTPDAAAVKLGYDSHGQPTAITDPNGVTTQQRYDDFGRKIMESNPDRGIALYRYDAASRLMAKIDETGVTTRYRYDAANRLLALGADKEPELVRYRYEGMHLAEVVGTPDGKADHASERTQYERNAFGQAVKEVRWIRKVDGKQLDNTGLSFITRSIYDDAGRLIEQVLPDGHRLGWRYTPAADEASQGKPGQLNAILFDGKEIVAGIDQTQAGGLTGYVSGNGIRQTIRLDGQGRIVQLQATAQRQRPNESWWERLKAGLVKAGGTPDKVVYSQTNRYDASGRLTGIAREETSPVNARAVSHQERYGYDRLDRLTEMESEARITHLRYDRGGNRIAKEDGMDKAQPMRVAAQETPGEERGRRLYRYAPGTNRLIGITQAQQEGQAARAPQTKEEAAQWIRSAWLYHATGVPLARLEAAAPAGSRRIVYNGDKRPVAVYDGQNRLIARYHYNLQGERIARTVYEPQPAMRQAALQAGKEQEQTAGHTAYSLYRERRLAAEADAEGRITAHYVYLNGMPVAKIETVPNTSLRHGVWKALRTLGGMIGQEAPQADDSVAAVYAIHTDQRGAPQVVTDREQRIVWQADTDAFGQARIRYAAQTTTGKTFEMNLRLPGQVYDAQTELHYNYWRDYDPRLGRYTTPDPLGLDGGMNPYAYAANNPLTNVDPLGLYQSDIHYYMTFFLAMAAGIDYNDARIIALATQYVDNNPQTRPVDESNILTIMASPLWNQNQLARYHFVLWESDANGKTVFSSSSDITQHDSTQLNRLYDASAKAPTKCAQLQFFGEYLHAFEDTFAHRDKANVPYGVNNGFGHGLAAGSNPDYTYNEPYDGDDPVVLSRLWTVREARTLRMEEEVFAKLAAFGDSTKAKSWEEVKVVVEQFNKIQENESIGLSKKIELLNNTLNDTENGWNYKATNSDNTMRNIDLTDAKKDQYDASIAGSNRNKNLCDKDGYRLNPEDYPGTILPKTECPK